MSEQQPRFAVMGSGGVGGYFGALLAKAGCDVTLIARGAHLDAIRRDGIVIDDQGAVTTIPIKATADPAEIGPVDYVLFSVKLKDTAEAGAACRPLIGPETAVVSLQNGVESESVLADVLGPEAVMGGVAFISAEIAAPGRISKHSPFASMLFGEMDGSVSPRAQRLQATLVSAGVQGEATAEIARAHWEKFVFLVGLSALTALTRAPIGPVRANPATRRLLMQVMEEVCAVGRAKGVALAEDLVAKRMAFVDQMGEGIRASMAVDLSLGKPLELPWLSGAVARFGEQLGVPTPANAFVTTALALQVDGA